jgi:hypothetical protein
MKRKTQNHMLAINTVLDKQEEQYLSRIFDDRFIMAERYMKTASSCQFWFSIVGFCDQQAVAEEYMD